MRDFELKLNMTMLKIGATEVPVYDFLDYPGDADHDAIKENFFALCLTKTELTLLTHAANSNLSALHDQYLVLRNEITATDDNGERYKRFEVRVNGWAKVGTNVIEREIAPATTSGFRTRPRCLPGDPSPDFRAHLWRPGCRRAGARKYPDSCRKTAG